MRQATITVTETTDGAGQFCSAFGRACCEAGPHTVHSYVSVRVQDQFGSRRWHFCPDAADLAATTAENFAVCARARGLDVTLTDTTSPEVTR